MERFIMEFDNGERQMWCEDKIIPEAGERVGKYIVQAKQKLNGVWHLSMDTLSDAGIK